MSPIFRSFSIVLAALVALPQAIIAGPTFYAARAATDDISAFLDGHNTVRAQHGAAPLTWNTDLANAALKWANGCVFEHSGGSLGPYGGTCVCLCRLPSSLLPFGFFIHLGLTFLFFRLRKLGCGDWCF
jgi:hypothetical protein